MSRGRPPFSFLLIDLPSDHEVDYNLATECQVIAAILHNRGFKSIVKPVRASSVDSFNNLMWRPYSSAGFVHLATHGNRNGVSLIGGDVSWSELAKKLTAVAPKLKKGQQRVLSLSCCHSAEGYRSLSKRLKNHFTGIYHFQKTKVEFATAMTVWSMFYRKKSIDRPAGRVVDPINEFFGEDVIVYRSV